MKIEDEYDVVVVGAGPAGSMAARFAAEKAGVLVVDKHREIGSPKRCGEGLGIRTFSEFSIPVDRRFINQDIYGSVIYAPNGREVSIRYDEVMGYIIERKIFDKYLATEAVRAGAAVMAESYATLWMEDGKLKGIKLRRQGEELDIRSRIVIAADGVESQIARQMGLNTTVNPYDMDSCIEYEMCGIDYKDMDMLHIFLGNKIAPRGYVWIFPKDDDRANVGIGIAGDVGETAKYYLDKFIAEHQGLADGSILEVNVGSVPVGGFLENMVKDNLLVVGDAARQVNPIHGGGISEAMHAGRLAGTTVAKAVKEDNLGILGEYNEEWWSTKGLKLKKVLKVRNFTEKLDDEDLDYLATIWSGEDLMEITRGNHKTAFKKIVKHPKLLKWVKNFL
ncbi:MAG: NAD(P)/FAD-dependent oxidoreductase [Candidatus Altiarchaeota archaeon]|nr:NAD(P)/FAD-dependent oxidoreductase [Candidatus Altiarchaeota archaeon]